MRKMLNILAITTIVGASSSTTLACGNKHKESNNNSENLTTLQKDMFNGVKSISKMIIGSRHENLNFNLNEILSMYLTPTNTALRIPTSYSFENKQINALEDVIKFKNLMFPSINKFDVDNYAGMYASYVMGMYDDDFYQNFIKGNNGAYSFEDTFSASGNVGNNKPKDNATGYLAGLNKDLKLSNNQERRNLSWGIQDTGALTNFLLNNGLDGGFPGDTNSTSGPKSSATDKKGGTNGGGYAWYNSLISTTKGKNNANKINSLDINTKLNNDIKILNAKNTNEEYGSRLKFKGKDLEFNNTGSLLTNTAGKMNINGYINMFGGMPDNIFETESGALVLGEYLNYVLPTRVTEAGGLFSPNAHTLMQQQGFKLITSGWEGFYNLLNNKEVVDYLKTVGFDVNKDYFKLDKAPNVGGSGLIPSPKPENIGFDKLYGLMPNDINENGTNMKYLKNIIMDLTSIYKNLNKEQKVEFTNRLMIGKNTPFENAYSSQLNQIDKDRSLWNNIIQNDGQGGINLLNMLNRVFEDATNDEIKGQVKQAGEFMDKLENFKFSSFDLASKKQYLKILGYDNGKFKDGSFLKRSFDGLKNDNVIGSKEFRQLFAGFKNTVSNEMQDVHNKLIKYLIDDNYWVSKNVNISSTSNASIGAKLEFDLEYQGIGDISSNASNQYKKIDVPENFNPYQTKIKHQEEVAKSLENKIDKSRISGEVLINNSMFNGNFNDEDLIKYDGLGNYNNYKNVRNKYKIIWENISKDPDTPLWVITSLKCYNDKDLEFFNIY